MEHSVQVEYLRQAKNSLNNAKVAINQLSNLLVDSFSVNSKCIEKKSLDKMKNKINSQKKVIDKRILKLLNE